MFGVRTFSFMHSKGVGSRLSDAYRFARNPIDSHAFPYVPLFDSFVSIKGL